MTQYKIEKGVPLAKSLPRSATPTYSKYPFNRMEVGDSVVFDATDAAAWRLATMAARVYGKRVSRRFTTRRIDATTGRIWRIK